MKKKILAIQGSNLKKINIKTDTTLLLAIEAQKRGYQIFYFYPDQLSFLNGKVIANCQHIKLFDNTKNFYKVINCFFSARLLNFLFVSRLTRIGEFLTP